MAKFLKGLEVTEPLPIASGGTGGVVTPTLNGIVLGNTDKLKILAPSATPKKALLTAAAGGAPTWATIDLNYMPTSWMKKTVWQATTENIVLSGEQAIDGEPGYEGFRYLVRCQTDPIENGIYRMEYGAWTRDVDATSGISLSGAEVPVVGGLTLRGSRWTTTFDPNIGDMVDITPMYWFQFAEMAKDLLHRVIYTPTGSADPFGILGDVIQDDNYIYVKTSAGWKRSALATF